MPKVLFNIGFTLPTPPSNLHGQKRADYVARRKFYDLTADYNYFTYALNDKKTVKNKDAEDYFTRSGSNEGLFDTKGALSKEQVAEIKEKIANTESIIWHGFISFEEELAPAFDTQENAVKFLNQTFNAFIDRTHLKRDNICLYASLHDDTDHRHIHFSFFEKEPKRRDKNGVLGYTKRGAVDSEAIDNYLVSANMHVDEHGAEYFTARDEAMARLKETRKEIKDGKKQDMQLNLEINRLIAELPKEGRLQYNAKNMEALRPQIDHVAELLIASDAKASQAHAEMLKQLARVEKSVEALVKDNKLAYVNDKRMSKEQIAEVMQGKSGIDLKYVDLKNIDYFARLKDDYKARVGNVVLGLCKDIKFGDIRDNKRRLGKVNDKGLKIEARRKRMHRANVVGKVQRMLATMSQGERVNYLKTVQQIEREQEFEKMQKVS